MIEAIVAKVVIWLLSKVLTWVGVLVIDMVDNFKFKSKVEDAKTKAVEHKDPTDLEDLARSLS